jgi:hypothetical protein
MRVDFQAVAATRAWRKMAQSNGHRTPVRRPNRRWATWRALRRSAVHVHLPLVLAVWLAGGCAPVDRTAHPAASTAAASPAVPASASPHGTPHTLQYQHALPDCRTLQTLLPPSVISVHGSLGVAGRSVDGAAWQAVSCQYLDRELAAAVTLDRPATDPVDGQPAAAAAAAHPAALLASRAHCTVQPAPTAGPSQVLRCTTTTTTGGPTLPGQPPPAATVAYIAGPAGALHTLMVSVAVNSPNHDSSQGPKQGPAYSQRLANLVYSTLVGRL